MPFLLYLWALLKDFIVYAAIFLALVTLYYGLAPFFDTGYRRR
jgi:hypothetical protein